MQTQHCVLAVTRMLQEIISMHRCRKTTSILFVYTGLRASLQVQQHVAERKSLSYRNPTEGNR